jgi:hypothetical protein
MHDPRLEELLDRANVNHAQRLAFRAHPERSIELLERALRKRKVRNPAAYALSCLRRETDPETEPERVEAWLRNVGRHYAHDRQAFEEEILRALRLHPCDYVEQLRHRRSRTPSGTARRGNARARSPSSRRDCPLG